MTQHQLCLAVALSLSSVPAQVFEPGPARSHALCFGRSSCLQFSPDGSLLACGGEAGDVRLLRVSDGGEVWARAVSGPAIGDLAFAADGSMLAVLAHDLSVWSLPRGKLLLRRPLGVGHRSRGARLAWHPRLPLLAVAGFRAGVQILALPKGEVRARTSLGAQAIALAFSPDGKELSFKINLQAPAVWDWAADQVREHPSAEKGAMALAYLPNGRRIWGGWQGDLVAAGRRHKLDNSILRLVCSRDGQRLAVDYGRRLVEVFDARLRSLYKVEPSRPAQQLHSPRLVFALSPDGRTVATSGLHGGVRLWRGGKPGPLHPGNLQRCRQGDLELDSSGRYLAVLDGEALQLLDLDTGVQRRLPGIRGLGRLPQPGVFWVLGGAGPARCVADTGKLMPMKMPLEFRAESTFRLWSLAAQGPWLWSRRTRVGMDGDFASSGAESLRGGEGAVLQFVTGGSGALVSLLDRGQFGIGRPRYRLVLLDGRLRSRGQWSGRARALALSGGEGGRLAFGDHRGFHTCSLEEFRRRAYGPRRRSPARWLHFVGTDLLLAHDGQRLALHGLARPEPPQRWDPLGVPRSQLRGIHTRPANTSGMPDLPGWDHAPQWLHAAVCKAPLRRLVLCSSAGVQVFRFAIRPRGRRR